MLKHILAMAGSSPAAVKKALSKTSGNDALPARHNDEVTKVLELIDSIVETGKNKAVLGLISRQRPARSVRPKLMPFRKSCPPRPMTFASRHVP